MNDRKSVEKGKKKVRERQDRLNLKTQGVVIAKERKGKVKRVGRREGDVGGSDKLKGKAVGFLQAPDVQRDDCEFITISSDSER